MTELNTGSSSQVARKLRELNSEYRDTQVTLNHAQAIKLAEPSDASKSSSANACAPERAPDLAGGGNLPNLF